MLRKLFLTRRGALPPIFVGGGGRYGPLRSLPQESIARANPLGKMDPAAFKQTADIALKFGVIKKPADASAYTHEIWELAQKK